MDTTQPYPDASFNLRAGFLLLVDVFLITLGIHYIEPLSELLATSYFIPIVAAAYWWELQGAAVGTILCLGLYSYVSLIGGGDVEFVLEQLLIKGLLFYFAGFTTSMISRERKHLLQRLHKDEIQTIGALATAIDAKDHYTHDHSEQVMSCADMIAQAMGLRGEQLELLEYQAMLHDVGNIGMPDGLLNTPELLSEEEREIIKGHVSIGVDILKRIDSEGKLAVGVGQHHERHDGTGYPHGLTGDQISANGKILCVADAYTAMVSKRPYREALSREQAIQELKANSGTQFDPEVVEVFIRLLEKAEQ